MVAPCAPQSSGPHKSHSRKGKRKSAPRPCAPSRQKERRRPDGDGVADLVGDVIELVRRPCTWRQGVIGEAGWAAAPADRRHSRHARAGASARGASTSRGRALGRTADRWRAELRPEFFPGQKRVQWAGGLAVGAVAQSQR